jgi:predicted phage tail protein
VVEEHRNYLGKYILTLIFASMFLAFLSLSTSEVFAMGDVASSCTNRYDGTITSFIINNGTQTFDAIANPGVAFNVNTSSSYNVTFVIHTPATSSQNNTNPGTTWYETTAGGIVFGNCVPDKTTTSIDPNQNVTITNTLTLPGNYNGGIQTVSYFTYVNGVSYHVNWLSASQTPPSPPQNLQASAEDSAVNLSWSAPSNNGGSPVTSYNVYRGTSSDTETLLTQVGNVTSYNDDTVTNGQTYFYTVTAVNSVGESAQSNEASATPIGPPQPPTGLTATAKLVKINLSWTAPTNDGGSTITGYMIERSTNNGSTWSTPVSNTGSTGTTYSDTNVLPLTTYTYRVSAINDVGTSSPSNTASASTPAVGPVTPPSLP